MESIITLNNQLQNTHISYDCRFVIPSIVKHDVDLKYLLEKIEDKISQLYERKFLNLKFKQAEFKNSKWLNASIFMGTGLNYNNSRIDNLFNKRTFEYNVGVNISIPVSDLFFNERAATLLKIESDNLELSFKEDKDNLRHRVLKLYNELNINHERYLFFMEKEAFMIKETSLKLDLYLSNRILFTDLDNALNAEFENTYKKNEAIRSFYMTLSQIEETINLYV